MPCVTRRTVNVLFRPPWRRRITTPSNTWVRSREPSTILTWTRTLSPGPKSGSSGFRKRSSTARTRSIGMWDFSGVSDLARAGTAAAKLGQYSTRVYSWRSLRRRYGGEPRRSEGRDPGRERLRGHGAAVPALPHEGGGRARDGRRHRLGRAVQG